MNDYLDSKVSKQTQKVIDANKDDDKQNSTNQDDVKQDDTKQDDTNQNTNEQNITNQDATNQNIDATDTSVIDKMMDSNTNTNTNANPNTPTNTNTSVNIPLNESKVEDTVIQQNDETAKKNIMSDSQTNNINCFVRTLTVENINMFNNGSLSNTTIQSVIEKFIQTFNNNFEDLNTLPIGSIVYSIVPIHVSNDIFVHGRYYLRSLTNSNDPMDMIYNYQFQLPEHWRKASDFRFPNMKDRALQGKTKINFNLTDSEHKIQSNNDIDLSKNIQDFTHTELKAVDFSTDNNTEIRSQKGVLESTAFWIKRELNSKLQHGANNNQKVIYTPKVLDQQSKLFFYVVLGYVQNV